MKITHRAPADATAAPAPAAPVDPLAPAASLVPRLACCCRLSELLPMVRQAHDAARDARLAQAPEADQPGVAA